MTYFIEGYPFLRVCEIIPEFDECGKIKEFAPQKDYKNHSNIPLNKYGSGSFCKFKIPKIYNGKRGVYLILADKNPKYVGECEDLRARFNSGYGNISPRNCYIGGQETNCRLNKLLLEILKNHSKIELFFLETPNLEKFERCNIENNLILKLKTEWNK